MTTSSTSSTDTGGGSVPVSIASSSSAGAAGGSVINVSSLVSQLVAATQDPQQAVITSETEAVTSQISALGTLKSALSTFQSSLSALDTAGAFDAQTATSSAPTAFTATATSAASAGTYSVSVTQLATAQQLLSSAFTGTGATVVGTGSLSVSLGGSSFDVTIGGSNDTLNGIAAAINSASDNPGITATVLQGTNGAHLVLSSALSGAGNTIQVSETDGGGELAALTYGPGNTGNYTQQSGAQNAIYSIAGVSASSSSNTVSGALGGVTLNLLAPVASGADATLTVANDTATITGNISNFVAAYNTLVGSFSSLGSYDSSTSTAGPMMGSALLGDIQNQTNQAVYSLVNTGSSTYNSLASIGITTNSDGTLSLNTSTLSSALSSNFSAVSQLFSGASGVATQLNSQITAELAAGGSIDEAGQTLTTQENALTTKTDQLNTQMAALSASLTEQYSALNTLLSSLQTTSSYLTQAFASLPTVQGVPNA